MGACSGCSGCSGSCGKSGCRGCGGVMELSEGEIIFLQMLGQYSFLPVARRREDMIPYYLEDTRYTPEEYSLIIQCLEKRGLVDLDYRAPLSGADMSAYADYPVHGSAALTEKGWDILELIELQGYEA